MIGSMDRMTLVAAVMVLMVLSSSSKTTTAFVPASKRLPTTSVGPHSYYLAHTTSFMEGRRDLFSKVGTKNSFSHQNVVSSRSSSNNNRGMVGLQMTASPAVVVKSVAAITGAISGGLFAGGLHAIAGPDHLAALLPRCCGQRWYRAGRIGALWGMGHGISAAVLGILAFGLKSRIQNMNGMEWLLTGASSAMEIAVGVSLVIIGLLGIREAREWEAEIDAHPQSLSAAAADPGIKSAQKRAVVFNGILHGLSWDGAPFLAPALAVATWRGNLAYLFAYALGTMGAMTLTTTVIGEGTRKAGQWLHRPDVPQKLSFASSILAIVIGGIWCGLALA